MTNYILGVILAISSGIINNIGTVFQKTGVNSIPVEQRKNNLIKQLIKLKIWWIGTLLAMVVGTVFFMWAQIELGLSLAPALVPGLMATGLIFLAIGSARINKEILKVSEWIGIVIMIGGITFIGISGSSNTPENIIFTNDLLVRIAIFTIGLFIVFFLLNYYAKKGLKIGGVLFAVASGLCYALSNFWVAPVMQVMISIFGGVGGAVDFVILGIASIILIYTNLVGISTLQKGFSRGQASNLIPVQQVPIQISPIIVYFFIFRLVSTPLNIFYILIGISMIVYSGFLLGKRQAQMEQIK